MAFTVAKLKNSVQENAAAGELVVPLEKGKVRCLACGHYCLIPPQRAGICKVRYNREGKLFVPYGYVAAFQIDPIEKKPFFHAFPGSLATSFGMLGCDFHCAYCQNWITSQALRDEKAIAPTQKIDPDFIIKISHRYNAKVIASTYNEPLITAEWAKAIFTKAKEEGFFTAYISNGNATKEALRYIRPVCDLYKVDLKCFDDKKYRKLGGTLKNICDSIVQIKELGFWLEIVTLLVPGYNDQEKELKALASFIVSVSPEIPWHITAFHPDYKMLTFRPTRVSDLYRAAQIGKEAGLQFIYLGNLPGQVGEYENTHCPACKTLLIKRYGMRVEKNYLQGNCCPTCHRLIPGFFQA